MSADDCLACGAARRDTLDLFRAVVEDRDVDSPRAIALVSGMDGERSWRVAFFMAGIASGLADAFSDATGLPVAEIVQIFAEQLTGAEHHEH